MIYQTLLARISAVTACAALLGGCSTFSGGWVQDPEVTVRDVHIQKLDFDQATLALDLDVFNPNNAAARLAGFDYQLKIDGAEFLKGEQSKGLSIAARSNSVVQVPFTLKFRDLYDTFTSLQDKERFAYALDCGLKFDVPLLGTRTLPISKSGTLPVVKPPTIDLGSVALQRTSLLDQRLLLSMKVSNPNSFGLLVNKLDYDISMNGRRWAQGITDKKIEIKPAGESEIALPVSVDILSAGAALADIISSRKPVTYAVKGSADLGTSIPEFSRVKLPFNRTGTVSIGQ